ncbi:YdcF family protein [Flammeovirga aprica]|nr:YdcF family protein [Flammeovirga aprica]
MKTIKFLIYIGIIWFIIHEAYTIIDGIYSQPKKSEFAIIFGNTVNEDGSLSSRLEARVKEGLDLYNAKKVSKLFVSGGLGKEGHYEGQRMALYLIRKGVPQKDIVIDDKGNTSWATAVNFKEQFPDCKSVVVVSQFYHITRSKLALRKVGLEEVSGASPDYFEARDFYGLFREFFGFYKYCFM